MTIKMLIAENIPRIIEKPFVSINKKTLPVCVGLGRMPFGMLLEAKIEVGVEGSRRVAR
jgi:hypothetical protein